MKNKLEALSNIFSGIFKEKVEFEETKIEKTKAEYYTEDLPEILKMNSHSYKYYSKHVKDNEEIPYDQACRKMTRSMIMAVPYKTVGKRTWYAYGRLHFLVKNGEVTWIENNKPTHCKFEKHEGLYHELGEKLGIDKKWSR